MGFKRTASEKRARTGVWSTQGTSSVADEGNDGIDGINVTTGLL